MAICCQLDQRKECTRNTEILKTLMGDCPVFTFRVKQISDHFLLNENKQLRIKKYIINLFSNDKLLDESFETIAPTPTAPITKKVSPPVQAQTPPPPIPIQSPIQSPIQTPTKTTQIETVSIPLNELKPFSVHEFKLTHFASETEIYFNLFTQLIDLEAMQVQINADEAIIRESKSPSYFKRGDLVLAKFMNENGTFDWYRARITNINDLVYEVFYIDYGNVDSNLKLDDLRPLPAKYSKQAQFAYKIILNGIVTLDMEAHDAIIGKFLLFFFNLIRFN